MNVHYLYVPNIYSRWVFNWSGTDPDIRDIWGTRIRIRIRLDIMILPSIRIRISKNNLNKNKIFFKI